jgi:hypothetical protein
LDAFSETIEPLTWSFDAPLGLSPALMAVNRLAICLSSLVWHRCNVSSANGSLQIAKTLAKQKIKDIQESQTAR